MPRLEERMERISRATKEKLPPDVVDVMARATEQLRRSGLAERVVGVGDRAPDFALADGSENEHRLSARLARGPVVLTFYRGRW